MRRTEVRIGDEGRVILLLRQVQTAPGFIEISQREMHGCVLGIQAQRLFVGLQGRLELALLGERAGEVGVGHRVVRGAA